MRVLYQSCLAGGWGRRQANLMSYIDCVSVFQVFLRCARAPGFAGAPWTDKRGVFVIPGLRTQFGPVREERPFLQNSKGSGAQKPKKKIPDGNLSPENPRRGGYKTR